MKAHNHDSQDNESLGQNAYLSTIKFGVVVRTNVLIHTITLIRLIFSLRPPGTLAPPISFSLFSYDAGWERITSRYALSMGSGNTVMD